MGCAAVQEALEPLYMHPMDQQTEEEQMWKMFQKPKLAKNKSKLKRKACDVMQYIRISNFQWGKPSDEKLFLKHKIWVKKFLIWFQSTSLKERNYCYRLKTQY